MNSIRKNNIDIMVSRISKAIKRNKTNAHYIGNGLDLYALLNNDSNCSSSILQSHLRRTSTIIYFSIVLKLN